MNREELYDLSVMIGKMALSETPIPVIISEYLNALCGSGLALGRASIGVATIDARLSGYNYVWLREKGMERNNFAIDDEREDNEEWINSPIYALVQQGMIERRGSSLRYRLQGPEASHAFPVFDEFRTMGLTDWYGQIVTFSLTARQHEFGEIGMVCTFQSEAEGGFTAAQLRNLDEALPLFALAIKSRLLREIGESLLQTYLGRDAGSRVFSGEITRGSISEIPAVLMIADLRGFTGMANDIPLPETVSLLNRYFDMLVTPIERHGGQVLKFMGDGLLAIFPYEHKGRRATRAAIAATLEARAAIDRFNAAREGQPSMSADIALHLGDVYYGNVGSENRLDFTVIGPAVNEASRMEGLCRQLGIDTVISGAFRNACPDLDLRSLGRHALRGIPGKREIFTLPAGGDTA